MLSGGGVPGAAALIGLWSRETNPNPKTTRFPDSPQWGDPREPCGLSPNTGRDGLTVGCGRKVEFR